MLRSQREKLRFNLTAKLFPCSTHFSFLQVMVAFCSTTVTMNLTDKICVASVKKHLKHTLASTGWPNEIWLANSPLQGTYIWKHRKISIIDFEKFIVCYCWLASTLVVCAYSTTEQLCHPAMVWEVFIVEQNSICSTYVWRYFVWPSIFQIGTKHW